MATTDQQTATIEPKSFKIDQLFLKVTGHECPYIVIPFNEIFDGTIVQKLLTETEIAVTTSDGELLRTARPVFRKNVEKALGIGTIEIIAIQPKSNCISEEVSKFLADNKK